MGGKGPSTDGNNLEEIVCNDAIAFDGVCVILLARDHTTFYKSKSHTQQREPS